MEYKINKIISLDGYVLASVLSVVRYTNTLFSFTTRRSMMLTFRSGEYVTLGLIIRGELVFRDYYICSPT